MGCPISSNNCSQLDQTHALLIRFVAGQHSALFICIRIHAPLSSLLPSRRTLLNCRNLCWIHGWLALKPFLPRILNLPSHCVGDILRRIDLKFCIFSRLIFVCQSSSDFIHHPIHFTLFISTVLSSHRHMLAISVIELCDHSQLLALSLRRTLHFLCDFLS